MLVAADAEPELAGGEASAWSKTGWFLLVTHPLDNSSGKACSTALFTKFLSYEGLLLSSGHRPSNTEWLLSPCFYCISFKWFFFKCLLKLALVG